MTSSDASMVPSPTGTTPTLSPFRVDGKMLGELDARLLVDLVSHLLQAEAIRFDLPISGIHVPTNLTAPDGGEDARIRWERGLERTDFLPGRFVQFQMKASDMSAAESVNELVTKDGNIKPMVSQVLKAGGRYRLISTQRVVQQGIEDREKEMRNRLQEEELLLETDQIGFIDADRLATWVNAYQSVTRWLLRQLGRADGGAFRDIENVMADRLHARSPRVVDRRAGEVRRRLRTHVVKSQSVLRVIGPAGIGRTRLVMDALTPIRAGDRRGRALASMTIVATAGSEHENARILEAVEALAACGSRAILLIDDVSGVLHEKLVSQVERSSSQLSLVSIMSGFRLRELGDPERIVIDQVASDRMVSRILEQQLSETDLFERGRVMRLARGHPAAALEMANAWGNTSFAAGLGNDELVSRHVLGAGGHLAIRSLMDAATMVATFGPIPIKPSAHGVDWVAELAPLVSDELPATVSKALADLVERGICRHYGEIVSFEMRPFGWHLAQSFWHSQRHDRWDELLMGELLPLPIRRQAAENLAELNTTPIGSQVASHLCRSNGPFDQEGALLKEGTDNVLTHLAEIDSASVVSLLRRTLRGDSSGERWVAIPASVQNAFTMAIAIEAIPDSGFASHARQLLHLAVVDAKAGTTGSARGHFLSMYRRQGVRTRASLDQRMDLIDGVIKSDMHEAHSLALEALVEGVETGTTAYPSPSSIGTLPLDDPDRILTIDNAVRRVLAAGDRLALLGTRRDDIGAEARSGLGRQVRRLLYNERHEELERWSKQLRSSGVRWTDAIVGIGEYLRWPKGASPTHQGRARLLLCSLRPTRLDDRLRDFVSIAHWTNPYLSSLDEEEEDEAQSYLVSSLGTVLAARWPNEPELLVMLCKGTQLHTESLGRALIEGVANKAALLTDIESAWMAVDSSKRNAELACGVARYLAEHDQPQLVRWKTRLAQSRHLVPIYSAVVERIGMQPEDVPLLLSAVAEERVSARKLQQTGWPGPSIEMLDSESVQHLVRSLLLRGSEFAALAIDCLSIYVKSDIDRIVLFEEILFELIERDDLNPYDNWRLTVMLEDILRSGVPFGRIGERLAERLGTQLITRSLDQAYDLKNALFSALLDTFPEVFWGGVTGMITARPERVDRLRSFFESPSISPSSCSAVWAIPNDSALAWVRRDPSNFAEAMALLVPTLEQADEEGRWSIHPRFTSFLVEFSDYQGVGDALLQALWPTLSVGNSARYHWERLVEALTRLGEHDSHIVRDWADEALDMAKGMLEREHSREQTRIGLRR